MSRQRRRGLRAHRVAARAGASVLLTPLLLVALLGSHAARADEPSWYDVLQDDRRVGTVQFESRDSAQGRVEIETLRLDLQQGRGHRLVERRLEALRAADGTLRELDLRVEGIAAKRHWHGRIEAGLLTLSTPARHAAATPPVPVRGEPFFVAHAVEALQPLGQGEQRSLRLARFDPGDVASRDVEATLSARGDDALEVRTQDLADPSRRELWTLSPAGLIELRTPLFGEEVIVRPCRADCPGAIDKPLDPLAHLIVRSPVKIPAAALHRTLRYVFAAGANAPPFPATGEQRVQRAGDVSVITVCADCGDEPAPDAATLQRYLAPNAWVRSDARDVVALAHSVPPMTRRVDRRMHDLERRVKHAMRGAISYLGYADAEEALRTGSGDCTEYAVLLAALARARGIPTRVVSGLAYASRFTGKKDVFSPHMWVQAWDGRRWTSYDAALAGFDSTHIVLAIGDGAPAQYETAARALRGLRLEKAGVVRDSVEPGAKAQP